MVDATHEDKCLQAIQVIVTRARFLALHGAEQADLARMLDRVDWLIELMRKGDDRTAQFARAVADFCDEFSDCMHLKRLFSPTDVSDSPPTATP